MNLELEPKLTNKQILVAYLRGLLIIAVIIIISWCVVDNIDNSIRKANAVLKK